MTVKALLISKDGKQREIKYNEIWIPNIILVRNPVNGDIEEVYSHAHVDKDVHVYWEQKSLTIGPDKNVKKL